MIGGDNIDKNQTFIHIETKVDVNLGEIVLFKDLGSVSCIDKKLKEEILNIEIFNAPYKPENLVISTLNIVNKINKNFKNINLVVLGPSEILIDISDNKNERKLFEIIKVAIVSLLLFFGAALAITNFHEDVNLEESFNSIYTLITGKDADKPLILQIPYSLGLGVGMATFFYHIFSKNKKSEPSPLEIEVYNYQKNIDEYVLDKTKHNNNKRKK